MTDYKEDKIDVNPNEFYKQKNAELNTKIQEFNAAVPGDTPDRGPGAGEQGTMWPTHLDPAMRQCYPVDIVPELIPGKEMPGTADKSKNREARDPVG